MVPIWQIYNKHMVPIVAEHNCSILSINLFLMEHNGNFFVYYINLSIFIQAETSNPIWTTTKYLVNSDAVNIRIVQRCQKHMNK